MAQWSALNLFLLVWSRFRFHCPSCAEGPLGHQREQSSAGEPGSRMVKLNDPRKDMCPCDLGPTFDSSVGAFITTTTGGFMAVIAIVRCVINQLIARGLGAPHCGSNGAGASFFLQMFCFRKDSRQLWMFVPTKSGLIIF